MDFTEIIKAMETMTDAQLASIQKSAAGIIAERDLYKKVEAIKNFKKAFSALRKAGVSISVECDCEEYYDDVCIEDVDQFDFS